MIVVATDAPLDARDLKRLAARAIFAMAHAGSSYSNGSGDFAIAFSTHPSLRGTMGVGDPQQRTVLPTDGVTGSGRTIEPLPIDLVRAPARGGGPH